MSDSVPPLSEIRDRTQHAFGHRPCLWQIKAVQAILKGDKDVITIAETGSGKTLTFFMPLLFKDGYQVVVTPLNILGTQTVQKLAAVGISAIAISAATATPENFRVSRDIFFGARFC